jgi:hypothetical protein
MANVFNPNDVKEIHSRIEKLAPDTQAQWGKMDVAQMMAHVNVPYEMAYEGTGAKATGLKRILLTWFVKPIVAGPKPYKKNSRTAPEFIIADKRVFDTEKARLVGYVQKTLELGEKEFEGKASNSFGNMTAKEWNTTFYKHLDHHLNQFGV